MNQFKTLFSKLLLSALAVLAVAMAPGVARADGWFACSPTEVMELSNRVHVRCSNTWRAGSQSIRYIAISNSSSSKAQRFINIGNAALLSNRWFYVYLRTSSATNVSGCLTTDCRTPTAFAVRNR